MITVNETLRDVEKDLYEVLDAIEKTRGKLFEAQNQWPAHQVGTGAVWHGLDEVPPNGWIWASDGIQVWLIMGLGKPINPNSGDIKYWTEAFIPAPPMVDHEP